MPVDNSPQRYGVVAKTLHWLIAVLILANIALGFYMGTLSRHDPSKILVVQTHKSIGLTVLVLSFARLGWRLVNPVPRLPADMSAIFRILARATHWLFYILMIGIPLSGWAMVSASSLGPGTSYFGLFEWPNIPLLAGLPHASKMPMRENFETAHGLLAYSAIPLLALHVAGALYHHFIRHDNVLSRMWPGTRLREPA